MKKLQRKALSVFLALVLLCGLFPTAYAAEQTAYSDTHGHWAEDAIARWSDYGIVQGNNGKFDPDSSMTRAQAAMVFAKLLGLEQTADLSAFADVPADAWYTDAMAKCYAAGILKGVAADRLNPEGTITREMFFVMFARAMGIEEETELNKEFSDAANISSWARGSVYALINHGYVNGVNETAIGPDNLINRASVMALLDQAITEYTVENGKPVITLKDAVQKEEEKKPTSGGGGGSSGNNGGDTPPSYEDLTVSEAGTIITGGTYRNVTIAPSVGDGEVALNGVTITGNLVVQGGGSNSIKLNNCTVGGKVVLDKDSADPEAQQPRLELTDTPVSTVEVAKPAILEATDGNSAVAAVEAKANVEVKGAQTAVATVTVPATAEAPVAVTVTAGTVDKVEAKSETTVNAVGTVTAVAAEAPVTVASGSVETVTVPATVTEPVTVTVSNSASVETVDAKGATTVSAEANALVGTVAAEAPVTVSSGTVNTITVPPTASESVAITVGSGATVAEVTVRSDKGTTITNNGTVSNVSAASETIKESVAATGTPEVVSHIHVWDGGIVTTPASCTTTGSKTFKCTVDGCTSATKVEAIPATGHNWSDWTENQGADTHTRVCQNDSQHTETADHAWDNGVVTKAATCAEKGVRTYTCSTCTATKTEEIGMLPHTEVIDAAKAPSCEETGLTEGKHCSVCNAVIVAQTTVDALGHDFTVAQYDNSQHWEKCSRCDATDTKADHSYAAHNCDAAAKCQDCEYVKPAGAHSYGAYEQTKAPTCTEKGSEKAVCSVCNHEITRDVDALGHNYGAAKYTWTKSDNDTGYTCAGERVCANDASHKDQATATVASAVTKPATCTEKGETTYTATFEKDGFAQQTKTEEIPAKGHTEETIPGKAATCTETGLTEGTKCSVCGEVLKKQEEIPAKGHTWDNGVVTTPPTETAEGVKTYTCTVCGETRTEAIPATGGSAETISNIRFEKSNGQLYLKWDGQEADNLKYNIYLTKDGGQNWTKITSTSQLHLTMQLKDAGTYNGVKIVPRINNVEDASKACVDTSIRLTIGAETGTAPTKVTFIYNAEKSEEWGYTENGAGAYDYTITGLTPNTPYQMEMKTALDATSVSSDGSTSNTAGTGSGISGGSELKTCVEQGYYRIYEFTNVQVDSSGKTVSYTATSRGGWTKCTADSGSEDTVPAVTGFAFNRDYGDILLTFTHAEGADTDNIECYAISFQADDDTWTEYQSSIGMKECFFRGEGLNGHYNKIKITSIADSESGMKNSEYIAECDVTVTAVKGTALDSVTFAPSGTTNANGTAGYTCTVSGLTAEIDSYLVYLSDYADGKYASEAFGGTEASTTLFWPFLPDLLKDGYYLVREFSGQSVASASSCQLTVTERGTWTKCTPSAFDAQQLLADAKDANLLTWLTLTEAQLPVNVTRLDMAKLVAAYMNLSVTPVPEAGFMFSDCTDTDGLDDTERGVIMAVVDAKIIVGTPQNTFSPNGTVTRAQIADFLCRMLDLPTTGGTVPFTDVPTTHWAYPYIAALYERGLISGTSPTTFEPNLIVSKEAALRLLLNAKGWTDPRTPVAAVSGFTFVKTDDTLRTKITKPDVGAIERFEFAFLNSTDGQWKYVGGCGAQDNGIPIYADLPTGTYTKVRVTSVPNDFTKNLPGDAEFNCNLTITNTSGVAPASVEFTEVTDSNNNSGYSVTVKGLALATKQTVVVLAERKNGDGRRGNMSGDKFSDVTPSDKSVTITIYDQFDARLIPNGYYQVLEVLDANVGSNETTGATGTTATLKVNARGGWEKVNVGNLPATSSSISNIRFEELSGGLVALEWDFTRGTDVGTSSVMFRVIAEGPNGEHVNSGTGRTEAHLTFPAGTYTSFTVKAVDTRNQNTVFATATESLTMNVASGATSNTASAAFTKDGTEYQTVISGLSGYLAYHIYVEVPDGNGIRRSGSFGPVENAGSAMGYLPAEDIEAAGAKYSIYGVKAYTLNNGALSYTIDCLREPTAIPAMPATTYTFTIAMQKATNDGQYHPSINGQSTNNVRKMQFENEVSVSHAALPTDYTRNRGGNIYFENCVFEEDVQVTYNDAFSYSVEFENCEFRNGAKVVVVGPTNLIQPGDGEVAPQTEIRFWECGGAAVESTTAPVEVSGTGSFTLNGMNVTAAEDTNASAAGNHYASVMYWPYAHETFYELVAEGRYSLTVSGAEATADTLRVSGNVDLSGFAPHSKQTIELHCWNDVSNINLGANKAVIEQPGVYTIETADGTLDNLTIAVTGVTVNGTQVNPACTISSIRFETKGNYRVLAWDSDMGSYPHYQIYYRNSETDKWEQEAGTDDTFLQVISGRGTAGVRVEAWIYDGRSDQDIMIGACENTALKIKPEWSQAAAAATVEFVADTAAASGYRVKIGGIPSGLDYLFLHMVKSDFGNGLLIKHNGAAAYEVEVPEWCKDVLPCDEYILNSYGSFALNDDNNTLSYTVTELAVSNYLPATSSISNIRFVQGQDGIVALEWDFTRGTDIGSDEVRFEVVASNSSDSSIRWSRETREFTMPMTALAGNYDTVTVNALNIKQGNSFITSDTKNLTVNAAVGTTANPNNASATFTDLENDKATANLSGLTGYQAFQMYVVDAENDRTKISAGTVSEDGTATVSVNADVVKAPGAVYSIYGVKAYTLNNGVLSYTIDCLREPTATLPAESGAPSNLHFELNQQGRFLLKWDGEEKTGVSYHLYRTSDGGNSWINCGNYSTAQAMPIFSSGNFNGFKVVPCLDNVEDESKALIDLTMRLDITPKTGTTVPTLSLARDDAKSQSFNYGPEGGYYNYSISGLAPNAAFQLYLSPDKKVSVARMGVAGENGSLISSIQGSGIKANVEGYCMVYQYTDTQIQDSGKTCTYTVTKMSDWVSVADMACQHQWDEGVVTQKPTGQNTGVKTYTCQKCGLTRTEVIPVLTKPYLTVEGGSVILHWKAELDSSEYCYINGERASKSMMNGWYYYGIPSDITESQSIVIGKGTDSEQTEVLYTLKDAVNVTILPEQNFTITGLENGKYQIAAPGMNTDGFYFKSSVKDEAGKLGDNSFSAFDGVVEMSPWEGCTVDVLLSRTSVNDAQNVVTIEKTPVATVTEITHYVPTGVAEVSTFDDMVAALKRGGTVRLMEDVTAANSYIDICTGPAATLELNGHTLNLSTYLSFSMGKDLTIIGNNASGARGQINGEISIQNGAQLHVTGGQYEKFYCYRARDVIMEDAIIEYNGTNSNGAVSMYSCDTVELRNCNVTATTTQALDITRSGEVKILGGSYTSNSTSYNTIEVDDCTSVLAENVTASSAGGSAAMYGYTPSIVVEGGRYTSTASSTSYAALYVYNNEGEAYVRGTSDQPLQVSGVKCALECRAANVWITDVNASGECSGDLVSVRGASYGEQNAVITRLTANGGKYALSIGSIYDVTVDSCVLNADSDLTGTYGLSIMGRSNYSGSKAVVKATSASGDYGIRVNGCDNLRITSSTAAGSAYSLYLNDCTNASVTGGELNGNVHLANQSQQPIEYTLSNLNVKGCLEAIGNYGSAKTDVELSDCNFVALAADEAVVYADNLAYITISGGSYTACNEDGYVLKSNPYSSNSACITVNGGSFRNTAASANVFAPLNNDVTDARYVVNGGSFSAALSGVSGITVNGNVNTSTDEGGETVYTVTVV